MTDKTQRKKSSIFPDTFTFKNNAATIALLSALLLATIYNLSFWHQLLSLPDISIAGNASFLLGTGIVLTGIFFTFFTLCSYPYIFKTVIIFSFSLASIISYFSYKYGIVIDHNMISNILETDIREASELFTFLFALHLLIFAGLPTLILARTQITWKKPLRQLATNLLTITGTLLFIGATIYFNYSSKGVATRVPYEKLSSASVPDAENMGLAKDGEYFDEALLYNLQNYIDQSPHNNILIVLHQKGSHGLAYYKRHPDSFSKFTPEYQGNAPQNSSRTELLNAYDNTILYTDYFLAKTIEMLKKNAPEYDTFLFYMSDHGESLGENGIYLHGLPYFMAPDEQKHIATIVWLSESAARNHRIDMATLLKKRDQPISHDYIFHSLLGIFGVKSKIYDRELDIFEKNSFRQTS